MAKKLLLHGDRPVVQQGYWIIADNIWDPGDVWPLNKLWICEKDLDGPGDLCNPKESKCWVVGKLNADSGEIWRAQHWISGQLQFTRVRTANTTWPSTLLTTDFAFNVVVDGDGNLYWVKHNRDPAVVSYTPNAAGCDPTLALQRVSTANSHTTANINLDSFAPSAPSGFPALRGAVRVGVVPQEEGLLALVIYRFRQSSSPFTTKDVSCVVKISDALSASTATPISSGDFPSGDNGPLNYLLPLPDGVIAPRSGGGFAILDDDGTVGATGSISGSGRAGGFSDLWWDTPTARFDSSGNIWAQSFSGTIAVLSSALADVTPSWLSALSDIRQFAISASGHRLAVVAEEVADDHKYRVYDCSDGALLLEWSTHEAADNATFFPAERVDYWQSAADGKFCIVGNGGWGIGKLAPDSMLATRKVANGLSVYNSTGADRKGHHFCRGMYPHFSYGGW